MYSRTNFYTIQILTVFILSTLQEIFSHNVDPLAGWKTKFKSTEDVEVAFLTTGRRKRELDSDAYHIVEIVRPASASTLQVHLKKSDHLLAENFQFVIIHGNNSRAWTENDPAPSFESRDHCVYSGTVTGVGSDSQKVTGHAVLSACEENKGFSGVITTNEGQYALEPQAARVKFYQSFGVPGHDAESNLTIRHTLSLIVEDDGFGGAKVKKCEAIYGPNDVQPSNMDDMNVEIIKPRSGHNESSLVTKPPRKMDVINVEMTKPPMEHNESTLVTVPPRKMDYINVEVMKPPMKHNESTLVTMTMPDPMAEMNSRRHSQRVPGKKPTSRPLIIELGIFADESFLDMIERKLKTKSVKTIKSYIMALVQMMAIRYEHPSISPKISFQLTRMEFLAKNPSEINSHHGSLEPFLESFCHYAGRVNEKFLWDHSMLLTGVDLRREADNSVVGVAYTGGLCRYRHSCSIIEGKNFGAANIMAHEMGHSLGMDHDGEGQNLKCDPRASVMAALVGPNQIAWSPCSNENLRIFLQSLEKTSAVRNGNCIVNLATEKSTSYKLHNKLPGELYSADMQCAFYESKYPIAVLPSQGHLFKMEGGPMQVDVCKQLYCTNAARSMAFHAHPALEGTECSPRKWCRHGECVRKP